MKTLKVNIVKILTGLSLLATLPNLAVAQNRVAFVSSATGSSDMSSWPQAGDGLVGLEAADSICINLAETAGLDNSANFIAWLTDDSDDAYCRVNQLSGQKDTKCGQAELPVAAGPWELTNGVPFGASIATLLRPFYEVYMPLDLDENGIAVPKGAFAWTGTGSDGSLLGDSCSNWTATTGGSAWLGSSDRTGASWTRGGIATCSAIARHLICLETLPGPELSLPELPTAMDQLAFITQTAGSGDLASSPVADPGTMGIAAGDSICNNRASAWGLVHAGSYKAWLSDASTDARDRFEQNGPWYRADGFLIAANMADLTDGSLATTINMNEQGQRLRGGFAWTGTKTDGTADGNHCNSWTSSTDQGRTGEAIITSSEWTNRIVGNCSRDYRLYCFSDFVPDNIFENGFESTN